MERRYAGTMLALALHQIDAAYWQEWDMFHVPGGIQGFLVFNLLALALLFRGYRTVVLRARCAGRWAIACGALGVATCLLHAGFFWAGHEAFALPLSIATLAACLVMGAALLAAGLREVRKP